MLQIIMVTWSRPCPFSEILFVHFREIAHMHPHAKFEVCSFTHFGDIFEGVPNFIRVTWPRPRPFSEILFVHFGEIVHMHPPAKFQVCSFTRFGDMFEGVQNFIKVTWRRPPPLSKNLQLCCSGLTILSNMPNIKCLLLFSSIYNVSAICIVHQHVFRPKIILRMRRVTW